MKQLDLDRRMQLAHDARSFRYFQNAVDRHWNPAAIDLSQDPGRLAGHVETYGEAALTSFRRSLRAFGIGEEAVTEDLAPLALVLEDINDQLFVTTQLYEEAKHTAFFDRYWREVVHPVEADLGYEKTYPTESGDYAAPYEEVFERTQRALERLLEDDSPEARVRAYCHYHLVVEGIMAQTGYFGMHTTFGTDEQVPEAPVLPGLSEGFARIRADEGRHVGFGMAQIKSHLVEDDVAPSVVHDTVTELMPYVQDMAVTGAEPEFEDLPGLDPADLLAYISETHVQRMNQITDVAADIPDIEALTDIRVGTTGE